MLGLAMIAILLSGGVSAVEADTRPPPRPRSCTPAAIEDIRLPFPVTVDEVRVVVADHSPPSGATTVRVDAGAFDRVVRVHGPLSQRLTFEPGLAGQVFHVSLDPVFEAPTTACIERVELVRRGVALAVVEP